MTRLPSRTGSCAVCGTSDSRALLNVRLADGNEATLCGTHDLMHRRAPVRAKTIAELREMFSNRRSFDRRRGPSDDTLADALSEAFIRDRRATGRRTAS